MTRFKPLLIGLLGSAAMLAAVPSWGDTPTLNSAATSPATAAQPAAPAAPISANPQKQGDAQNQDNNKDQDSNKADAKKQAMQTRMANRKAFVDARLAALHAGLQLTPQQEPLWSPVESALRDVGKARHGMRMMRRMNENMGDDDANPTARLKQRGEHLVALGQAIDKLADAAGPLVGSLSPDQKDRLPILLHGVGPHRIVRQAFAIEGGHDRMRDGERERRGGGGWHHRNFADRSDRPDMDRLGMDRPGMDRGDQMDHRDQQDHGGWRDHDRGWGHEGRANRDGVNYDRDSGPRWHHGDSDDRG